MKDSTNVDVALFYGDQSAIDFIDNAVDFLEFKRVRDDLVAGDDVLHARIG